VLRGGQLNVTTTNAKLVTAKSVGEPANDSGFGASVAWADVKANGTPALMIAAPEQTVNGQWSAGAVTVRARVDDVPACERCPGDQRGHARHRARPRGRGLLRLPFELTRSFVIMQRRRLRSLRLRAVPGRIRCSCCVAPHRASSSAPVSLDVVAFSVR
jgi:hypothetical protein